MQNCYSKKRTGSYTRIHLPTLQKRTVKMLMNVSQASRATGKSRSTINRHLSKGLLSRDTDGLIDTSELIRVYGPLQTTSEAPPARHTDTSKANAHVTALQLKIDHLNQQLSQKDEQLDREVELHDQAINRAVLAEQRLLEHMQGSPVTTTQVPAAPPEPPAPETKTRRPLTIGGFLVAVEDKILKFRR